MIDLIGVRGLPEIQPGDDVGRLIVARMPDIRTGDVVVVAQKVVSKAEGRLVRLNGVDPSETALALARRLHGDARFVQVVLDESVRVVRDERVLITETRAGYVCANGGVDRSNAPEGMVTLLPADCDASAAAIRESISRAGRVDVAVVVSDTFGRPWRVGVTNVALGVAGMPAVRDLRGTDDGGGRLLQSTVIALADEVACAAGLVMGKTERVPAVVVRGVQTGGGTDGVGRDLLRPAELDLFR